MLVAGKSKKSKASRNKHKRKKQIKQEAKNAASIRESSSYGSIL